jgi:hypothetical protein
MPVYVSVARIYCRVGELAGTHRKCTEGAGRWEDIQESTMEGPRGGQKWKETWRRNWKRKEVSSYYYG